MLREREKRRTQKDKGNRVDIINVPQAPRKFCQRQDANVVGFTETRILVGCLQDAGA